MFLSVAVWLSCRHGALSLMSYTLLFPDITRRLAVRNLTLDGRQWCATAPTARMLSCKNYTPRKVSCAEYYNQY